MVGCILRLDEDLNCYNGKFEMFLIEFVAESVKAEMKTKTKLECGWKRELLHVIDRHYILRFALPLPLSISNSHNSKASFTYMKAQRESNGLVLGIMHQALSASQPSSSLLT